VYKIHYLYDHNLSVISDDTFFVNIIIRYQNIDEIFRNLYYKIIFFPKLILF